MATIGATARPSQRQSSSSREAAGCTAKGPNPRFIVTSLTSTVIDGRTLYERVYCAREMKAAGDAI